METQMYDMKKTGELQWEGKWFSDVCLPKAPHMKGAVCRIHKEGNLLFAYFKDDGQWIKGATGTYELKN